MSLKKTLISTALLAGISIAYYALKVINDSIQPPYIKKKKSNGEEKEKSTSKNL